MLAIIVALVLNKLAGLKDIHVDRVKGKTSNHELCKIVMVM